VSVPTTRSARPPAVRVGRLVGFAACAATLAVMLPGLGASAPSAGKPNADCGREEFVSGLEAVFGRRKTQAQANALRTTVIRRGFVNANIIPGCDGFRVVIRGIDTFTIGVELQAEARREGFPVTLECIKAKEIGRLEAIFTHTRDRNAANAYIDRAATAGFPGLKYRPDPCGGFEVYLAGFKDRAEAEAFQAQAKRAGYNVVLERN
jgi:SPOR domain